MKRWHFVAVVAIGAGGAGPGTGCKCGSGAPADAGAPVWLEAGADVSVARAADVEELWKEAADAGDDELERLALVEGTSGLEERASSPAYRVTALRAMAFTQGFSAFPTLGAAAAHGSDEDATVAVESADAIAARKREQVDPEDDDELAAGCASLLAAAKDTSRARAVRIGAVRALRMLVDGSDEVGTSHTRMTRNACVKPDAIPTDVDVKR